MKIAKYTSYTPYTPVKAIALEAMAGKKISEIKKSDIVKSIKEAIIQAYIVLGQGKSSSSDQITILSDCLIYELKNSYKWLTIQEVIIAMDFGFKGKLCELTELTQPVISLVNILKFIKLYKEKIRSEAVSERIRAETAREQENYEAARISKIKALDEEITAALALPLKERESLPIGLKAAYYRHLDSQGKITLTVDEKTQIFEKAKKIIPEIRKRDIGRFSDLVFENKKRDAKIKELAQAMAFDKL